jgi:hypothetical protein
MENIHKERMRAESDLVKEQNKLQEIDIKRSNV